MEIEGVGKKCLFGRKKRNPTRGSCEQTIDLYNSVVLVLHPSDITKIPHLGELMR